MMIYVCGIHGVGKTFFCEKLHTGIGALYFTASKLIQSFGNVWHNNEKYVTDPSLNEKNLVKGVQKIKCEHKNENFILDSHLCMLNKRGEPLRITYKTMTALSPSYIVLLTENMDIIVKRRKTRDGIIPNELEINKLQSEEIEYAKELSARMKIPLIISNGYSDFDKTYEKIVELYTA